MNFKIARNDFYFDKREDLDAALHLIAHLPSPPGVTGFRLISNAEEAAAFRQEFNDALAYKGIKAEAGFSTEGYSDRSTMQEVYDGNFTNSSPAIDAIYAQEFMEHFAQKRECAALIRTSSYFKAQGKASMETARTIVGSDGGLVQEVPTHDPLDQFKRGWNKGAQGMDQLNRYVQRAGKDSELFEKRQGCTSDIAKRFLTNLADLVDRN